jgi:cytochrome P450
MVAAQITQKSVLPKSAHIMKSASHLLGKRSIVSANGGDWKSLRTMFNPGFSSSHLIATAVPGMVDDIGIFVQKLSSYADSGEIVCMFKPAMLLAIDMIGRVVMDTDFNSQRDENLLVNAFANQVLWTPGAPSVSLNPFILLNPVYKYMNWKYERQMYSFLEDYLERRFSSSSNNEKQKLGRKLRVIDIALEMYAGEKMGRSIFDKEFRKTAMDK